MGLNMSDDVICIMMQVTRACFYSVFFVNNIEFFVCYRNWSNGQRNVHEQQSREM
jgi:hypothetical protein